MKKLRSILVLFLLFSVMFMANEKVDASAGRLKSGSITSCNGTTYGEHAGHWHIAVQRGSYYYPSGSPVAEPNCGGASYSTYSNDDYTGDDTSGDKGASSDDIDKQDDAEKTEDTKPEISNLADDDEKTQDTDTEKESNGTDMAVGLVFGLIGGAGGSYLVRRKRSKKKKDDLTNW